MENLDIGKTIKLARVKNGISQKDLAEKIQVDVSAISLWEANKRVPSGDILIKLALELDIVQELFPGYRKVIDESKQNEKTISRQEFDQLLSRVSELEMAILPIGRK